MNDIITLNVDTDLFGREISEKSDINRDMFAKGLVATLMQADLEKFVSFLTNEVEATTEYVSLCAGHNTGQKISLLFNPHRLDTATKERHIGLFTDLKNPATASGLARAMMFKKGLVRELLYQVLTFGINGARYVGEFPPHVARDLAIEHSLTKYSHVLDPCAGWGGRMIGFSTVVDSYTCCEPSQRTAAGLRRLFEWLQTFRSTFTATIHEAPFEDVELPAQFYDLALTSPPYFDTEHYAPGEATNSFNRYATFDAWCDGFYAPLINKTMAALKPGASFVLNIGSRKYPLSEKMREICGERFEIIKQKGRLSGVAGFGKDGEGETFYEIRNSGILVVSEPPAPVVVAPAIRPFSALDFALRDAEPRAVVITPPIETPPAVDTAEPVAEPSCLCTGGLTADVRCPLHWPAEFAASLRARGHRLLTRDGKFFASDAALLTAEDREIIKTIRPALIALAEPYDSGNETSDHRQTRSGSDTIDLERGRVISGDFTGDHSHTDRLRSGSTDRLRSEDLQHRNEDTTATTLNTLFPIEVSAPSHAKSLAEFLGTAPVRVESNWVAQEPPSLDGIKDIVLNFATNGLDWKQHVPIGLTVSTLDGQLCRFLPFGFKYGGNLSEDTVKRWYDREVRGKHITNANMRFDLHTSRTGWGIDLDDARGNTFSDIMHTAALLDDHRKKFALDILAHDYLPGGVTIPRIDERQMIDHAANEVAAREEYTAQLVGQLRAVMYPQIDTQNLRVVHDLEDSVIPAVVEMETNGAPIDMPLLEEYSVECNRRHDALLMEISKEVGFSFDHSNSSWQRLFEYYHLPLTMKSDKLTFNDNVLSKIVHPTIQKGHLASQLSSLNSKIFKPYKENIGADGVLYFELNQLRGDDEGKGERGTVSGRFSAGYVQQVPNHGNHFAVFGEDLFPRRLYIPRSGEYLASDAAQIQYRIFAHHANNPKIMQMYRDDPKASFHRMIEKLLLPYKPDLIYEHLKSLNFMKIFGGKVIKVAIMMGYITESEGDEIRANHGQWTDPRLAVAREIEKIYAREMPEVEPLLALSSHLAMTGCDKWCKKSETSKKLHEDYKNYENFGHRGYVKTVLGRRSRFPTNYSLHKAFCMVDQGSEGDIMKTKIVELHRERKHTGFLLRQTVHDEVSGDALLPETAARVDEILNRQSFPQLRVPILFETKTGPNWAACK